MHTHITIIKKKNNNKKKTIIKKKKGFNTLPWSINIWRKWNDSSIPPASSIRLLCEYQHLEEMFFHDTSSNFSSVYLLCRILLGPALCNRAKVYLEYACVTYLCEYKRVMNKKKKSLNGKATMFCEWKPFIFQYLCPCHGTALYVFES